MPYHRPPEQSYSYLNYIRGQPCCICGNDVAVEAAHVRSGWAEDGKPATGMGEKSSDRWTLPLCGEHHRLQHSMNEREFWASHHIDALKLCLKYQVKAST